MFEYEFVKIALGSKVFDMELAPEKDYQEIIRKYAADGWRLVQVFAPAIVATGRASYYELIFEKKAG